MNADELVTVYTLTDPIEAELIRNALEAENIRCLLAGINQASAAGLPGTTIQVQVTATAAEQAREVLADLEKAHHSHTAGEVEE